MAEIRAMAERSIAAPAERVYSYIADFRQHHPHLLPSAFSAFHVERGGVGAGTVSRFRVTVGGSTRAYHMQVAEPEPGRVLTESDMDSDVVTTFTVTPAGDGCRVRIETAFSDAGSIKGAAERLFAPHVLGKLYEEELDKLDRYAQEQAGSPGGPAGA